MEAILQTTPAHHVGIGGRALKVARKILNSYTFYIFETLLACLFVWNRSEVTGAIVFVGLLSFLLVVCEDVLPTTLPFLLLCTFTTNCYDSFDLFIGYAIYAPIPAAALIYHFVVYKKPFHAGSSIKGILAVSLAITLGGVGNFSVKEYFFGSYYFLGLGIGMVVVYLLMKSQFAPQRKYDERARFATIMLLEGCLCVAMVLMGYWFYHAGKSSGHYELGFSRNNISTMLMFAMPFPVYLGIKKKGLEIFTVLFYTAICLTTSRGGLLFGSAEFLFCCAHWIFNEKHRKRRILRSFFCALALCVVITIAGRVIMDVINNRMQAEVLKGGSRWAMIWQSLEHFERSPLVGTGILDNSIDYGAFRKAGTMAWYHMMIPQIIGSMGLLGVAAYLYQFVGRLRLILKNADFWSLCLGISYLGVLMMSQVNPGEFCPLPYELLTVLLFIFQERRLTWTKRLPLSEKE